MNAPARARYPGAHPFDDDPLSRAVFFGRETESVRLADQVMANRLVVVYGRSGLGKTSLLNAGIAQRLRDEHFLPLPVRVNDVERGPLHSVWDGIEECCRHQGVELVPGDRRSLWHYFDTMQCWDGDVLLTPVLILDQFEELFTLQPAEARTTFVAALGALFHAVEPEVDGAALARADPKLPALRVVIGIREDFLGLLDELADRLPQILDCRFRVLPLNAAAARRAITEPAKVLRPDFKTRPFTVDPSAVEQVLDFLTTPSSGPLRDRDASGVEPFELQLLCEHIEAIAARHQRGHAGARPISASDLGGHRELRAVLGNHYRNQLGGLPWRQRRAVRRLCETMLVTPDGRRLSLDGGEIERKLRIPADTLAQLVSGRLLRADRRMGSCYYELSHDSLVGPVVANRRNELLVRGTLVRLLAVIYLFGYGLVALVAGTALLLNRNADDSMFGLTVLLLAPFLLYAGYRVWKYSREEFFQRARLGK